MLRGKHCGMWWNACGRSQLATCRFLNFSGIYSLHWEEDYNIVCASQGCRVEDLRTHFCKACGPAYCRCSAAFNHQPKGWWELAPQSLLSSYAPAWWMECIRCKPVANLFFILFLFFHWEVSQGRKFWAVNLESDSERSGNHAKNLRLSPKCRLSI